MNQDWEPVRPSNTIWLNGCMGAAQNSSHVTATSQEPPSPIPLHSFNTFFSNFISLRHFSFTLHHEFLYFLSFKSYKLNLNEWTYYIHQSRPVGNSIHTICTYLSSSLVTRQFPACMCSAIYPVHSSLRLSTKHSNFYCSWFFQRYKVRPWYHYSIRKRSILQLHSLQMTRPLLNLFWPALNPYVIANLTERHFQ